MNKIAVMYHNWLNIYRTGSCLNPASERIGLMNKYEILSFKQATYLTRMFINWLCFGDGLAKNS
jgi:hypothetical protein